MKCVWLPKSIGIFLDPPWSDLELHLCGDEYLRYARRLKSSYYSRKTIFGNRSINDRHNQQKDNVKGCYGIDDLDETINAEAQELMANDEPDSFISRGLEKSIDQSDLDDYEPVESEPVKLKREHLYSASANEIHEKKPELKDLPNHLEYSYRHGDKSFPIIISSELSDKDKNSLLQVLEKQKGAIAWKIHLNPKVQDVVKNEIVKLLDSGFNYPISDSSWVSPIHVLPNKGGMTEVLNDKNELIPSRTVTGWRVCIVYRKLNDATRKDHFPLPFIDPMLERLCGNEYYCFLDGFSEFFQIPIAPEDQEKITFTCTYGTFAYRRMPFGLCNAPATFQRCMTTTFHDMVEDFTEVFMDDFSVFGNSFDCCLANLDRMLARCEETNLAFNILKEKLTTVPIIISPDWNMPFELMCDASDFAVGAVFGQRIDGKFKSIYYASKTLNNAQEHYTPTEKELLAVVFSFDKFRPYLVLSKTIVYTNHSDLKYLFSQQDTKPRIIRWVQLLQGFDIEIKDKRWAENLAADHLSRLENPELSTFTKVEIADEFPDQHLMDLKTEINNNEPWYANYVNYLVGKIVPSNWTPEKRRRFFSQDLGSKRISTSIGEEFTNLEILNCWSLETSRRPYCSSELRELVDQDLVKHSKDHFRAPTTRDMEILIKTCLMPLTLKTQNDSFAFVHELKQEMHANLKYVDSLEKEVDKLASDKA
ncbi:reverse transcriptase domain-containing protein [Tanacetum coccineum]|uniref:Reverse transcriptase domain-containing protein n=1 Tax=Tanacetum coccineum TaxID=301880 RepID=A0ABQ5EVI9_9ASTR